MLFSLAIEPLAIAVRQNINIGGTLIGAKQHKILLYADDILLTLTDPDKSIPALTDCIKEFGQISGYKVNFEKSEIMPLTNGVQVEPAYVKPFCWAPKGFKYLGIKITPRVDQLYAENINPLINHIKEKVISWKKLPLSMLGRINLIKMIILPKIPYPVSMLFVFLNPNDLKEINKLISDFIWAGRKPKLKMDTLQLPKQQGGWGLPKIENYVLSIHARIVSEWATEQDVTPWLEIEKVISQPLCLITY